MALVSERVAGLVGAEGPRLTAHAPISSDELRRFVQAAMETDPVHWDPEAAARSRFGGVVAPPLYPVHVARRAAGSPDPLDQLKDDPGWDGRGTEGVLGALPPLDLPLERVLNGGAEAEFYRLARIGDLVSRQSRYVEISDKEGRSGPMVLVKVETSYTNQHAELLTRVWNTLIMR